MNERPGEADANVTAVITKHLSRAEAGLKKYGVTTERGDLTQADWLLHLQEELMDAAVYVEAALAQQWTQSDCERWSGLYARQADELAAVKRELDAAVQHHSHWTDKIIEALPDYVRFSGDLLHSVLCAINAIKAERDQALAGNEECCKRLDKACDLLRRLIKALHKPAWKDGESASGVEDDARDFISDEEMEKEIFKDE